MEKVFKWGKKDGVKEGFKGDLGPPNESMIVFRRITNES
jgi:hypothetical protein